MCIELQLLFLQSVPFEDNLVWEMYLFLEKLSFFEKQTNNS